MADDEDDVIADAEYSPETRIAITFIALLITLLIVSFQSLWWDGLSFCGESTYH